jgi:hypothetical protein
MATMDAMRSAIIEARERGWSRFTGDLSSIAGAEGLPGVRVIPQANGHAYQRLRPTARQDARRRSLSAIHGLDEFPLHTDAAHHALPPDLVLLQCSTGASETPTHVLPLTDLRGETAALFVQGIFMVGVGHRAFYSPAVRNGRLRYDVGCMRPLDSQARRVVDAVTGAAPTAVRFSWSKPGDILVVDNRTTLHGRGSVTHGPSSDRELVRVYLHAEEA